jgi:ERCC4-type nuclease
MIIKVDNREHEILTQIKQLVLFIPIFKQIKIVTENLPLGDFIIADETEDKLIIERKTVSDLLASIKDGRYDEQSYRLNGLNHHNHNIIYLIEGDINKSNRFKSDNKTEKLTAYSAMFSLNYFKGFSVFRTFSMDETALIICNMAYKLEKGTTSGKKGFYPNFIKTIPTEMVSTPQQFGGEKKPESNKEAKESNEQNKPDESNKEELEQEPPDKDYVNVIKKVKKENITPDNIGEIMLCQIPGISSVTALAIMSKFNSFSDLIKQVENNNECLKDVSYTNAKGQTRKINKTSIANIVKYLLKK